MLNVKAEGYAVSVAVSLCNPDGKEVVLPLEATALNERVVDFGQVCGFLYVLLRIVCTHEYNLVYPLLCLSA